MGFFEGFRAAMHGQESMELFERAYQEFAQSQPKGIMVTVFDGYRSYGEMFAESMMEHLPDGAMFYKFSGEEMPWREKTKILARAIDKIEKQPGAIKRQPGSPLLMPYFEWNEDEEKQKQFLDAMHLRTICAENKAVAEMVAEMNVELIDDAKAREFLLQAFTGIKKPELIEWLSTGHEYLIVQFMDIKPDSINEHDCLKYLAVKQNIQRVTIEQIIEFRKEVADTQMRLAFMTF